MKKKSRVATQAQQNVPQKNKRILLADDDAAVLFSLQKVLNFEGYDTECVLNGQRAIDMHREHTFDLIILDITMPIKNGWDAFEAITHIDPLTPLIIITARHQQQELAQAAGVSALLEKPIDMEFLLNTLEKLFNETHEERLLRLSGEGPDLYYQPRKPFQASGRTQY